jgi:ribosome biogenesis protein Nip4
MNDIEKFCKNFTNKEIINSDVQEIIKQGKRYFLANKEQIALSKKINQDFFSIGVFLGETKREFKPTPALIDLIAKKTDQKININKKSEWLFVCKRDIFDDSIIRKNTSEGLAIVQNERNETLGYGKFIRQGKRKLIKNLLDKGDYLRREH